MGFFGVNDPTRQWPAVGGAAPDVDRFMQLEKLRFGEPLQSAHFLGRPDEFRRTGKRCDLLYASKGLRLRFTNERLTEVSFLIGEQSSEHPAFAPAQPSAPDGTRLTAATDRSQIVSLFGEPDPGGSDETTLQIFHGHGVVSDFDLDPGGHLAEWSLYPED